MTLSEKVNELKKNIIFDSLTDSEYTELAEKTIYVTFSAGDIIFRENMSADAFYIIVNGQVEILKEGEDGTLEYLATRGEHDSFGEMSMIDNLPRSATIRAKTALELLMVKKADFVPLMTKFSSLSYSIARSVCNTIRLTNENYIKDLESRNKELQAAYNKLKETQDELIRSEKLSVIGKFASLIIHDIKNPLTNIRAYAELIGMSSKDNPKHQKSTGIIIREVDRLTDMTSELLEFARGDIKLNKSQVDFNSYLLTLIDMVSAGLQSRTIEFKFTPALNCMLVSIDTEKIKRVFLNLVGNSSDAMENGGTINMSAEIVNGTLIWKIADTGCGMGPDILEKIFEPFYTKKPKGTGLGMPIVKSIITGHQGDITVTSTPGIGTEFTIQLPAPGVIKN